MDMILITVIYLLSSVILLASGIISIMSNAYEFNVLNCIIGFIFIGLGIVIFYRNKYLQKILQVSVIPETIHFIRSEVFFSIIVLLICMIIFSGAYHRFFTEHKSLFG